MPKFHDHCDHSDAAFVQTLSHDGQDYDVYAYVPHGAQEVNVCLRYGSEGHEYLSPGSLRYVQRFAEGSALYANALQCVEDYLSYASVAADGGNP